MDRVTSADRVTPEVDSETHRVTSVVGKKALCACLGWSRPALDRRLRRDKNFPVLHCGRAGDAWRFDLSAVVAHLESSSKRRGRPPGATGLTSHAGTTSIACDLERAAAIARLIGDLVSELGPLLERVDAALACGAVAPASASAGANGCCNDS